MRRLCIFSIIYVLFVSASPVFALTYKDPFPNNSQGLSLSGDYISEAKLLHRYVLRYQNKIQTLYDSYKNTPSLAMQNAHKTLNAMALSLKNIQKGSISAQDADALMQSIVTDLKVLNIRMKVYLEQEKLLLQEKTKLLQKKYSIGGNKISQILDSLISKISQALVKKTKLTQKERKIVQSLLIIREESNKIKKFYSLSFNNEIEIKDYFKKIINTVRFEILTIKNLSR